jgi:hypothetical protein
VTTFPGLIVQMADGSENIPKYMAVTGDLWAVCVYSTGSSSHDVCVKVHTFHPTDAPDTLIR